MSAAGVVVSGLQAALLLARGRPEGMRYIDNDVRVAARSFWAAGVALPAFLCLRLLDWAAEGRPAHAAHAWALDLLFYVIGWAGYAVLSRSAAAALGRAQHWPRFITVWNWCNVVQYLLLVLAAIPALLGAPDWLSETASVVAVGWALWLEWFAAKLVLGVPGVAAAMLVLLDLLVGLGVAVVTAALA
jgi:hypothetical protein